MSWRPSRRDGSGSPSRPSLLLRGIALSRKNARGLFDALIAIQILDAIALVVVVSQVSATTSLLLDADGRMPPLRDVLVPGGLLAVALLVGGACLACTPAIQTALGERLANATAADVLTVAGALPLADFDRPEVLDRLKRVEMGAFIRPGQLAFGLGITLSGLVGALALTVAVATLAPWLAVVAVVAAAPLWWAAQRDGAHYYQTVRGLSRLERRRMYLAGLLTRREHAAEIRGFGLDGEVLRRYRALCDEKMREVLDTALARLRRQLIARAVGGTLLLAGLSTLMWLAFTSRVSLAQAVAAAAAGAALRTRLADAAAGMRQLQEAAEFVDDHATLLQDFAAPPELRPADETLVEVRLRGVGLTYPASTRPALHDVDLTLRAGEVTALVGANGSGKSTLATIASGLLEPTEGSVSFNGITTAQCPARAWRAQIAMLRQDAGRYQESVRDNIAFGDVARPVDDAHVRQALHDAGALPVLDQLDDDLDAVVGVEQDGGLELSGGQWQRLALARVFYRGGRLLVLDEPSAPLDPLAERDLVERLNRSFADRAVLLVTHRMSAAACADQVVVLDGGRIVEHGTPAQLLRAGGRFALMYEAEDSMWQEPARV